MSAEKTTADGDEAVGGYPSTSIRMVQMLSDLLHATMGSGLVPRL